MKLIMIIDEIMMIRKLMIIIDEDSEIRMMLMMMRLMIMMIKMGTMIKMKNDNTVLMLIERDNRS